MAHKGSNRGDGGTSKIRFIMLEVEGNAADLQQISQAITSAVRPPPPPSLAATPHSYALPRPGGAESSEPPSDPIIILDSSDGEAPVEVPRSRKPASNGAKKKLPVPQVLELDLNLGSPTFAEFFRQKNPDNHNKRYLVIAAWLKEHLGLEEINIDHIYTCYRTLSLNVVSDVGSIFRACKAQGWFNSASKRGWFAINHVGLNQVNIMGDTE